MKKIMLTIILILVICTSLQAQWWNHTPGPYEEIYTTYDSDREVIVGVAATGETWEWSDLGWVLIGKDEPFANYLGYDTVAGLAYDKSRKRLVFFIKKNYPKPILKTYERIQGVWKLVDSMDFNQYSNGNCAYHETLKKVLFLSRNKYSGGKRNTWIWDGKNWKLMDIGTPDISWDLYDLAWDHKRKCLVLASLSDSYDGYIEIWEMTSEVWKDRNIFYRIDFSGIDLKIGFNPLSGQIWMGSRDFLHDRKLLTWDGDKIDVIRHYPVITGNLVTDYKNNRLLSISDEVWQLGKKKPRLLASRAFPGRYLHYYKVMAYNSDQDRVILFNDFYTDLAEWRNNRWFKAYYPRKMPPTEYGKLCYYPDNKETIYFGGRESGQYPNEDGDYYPPYNHTYSWNGKVLERRKVDAPEPRSRFSFAYNSGRKSLILFGGDNIHVDERARTDNDYFGGYFSDFWEYKGNEWRMISSSGPRARSNAAIVYDQKRKKVVLFGGYQYQYFQDTWEWDENGWHKVAVTGPSPRSFSSMIFDESIQKVLLFCGSGGNNSFRLKNGIAEVWVWDGKTWKLNKQASGNFAPTNDSIHYDRYRGQAVTYNKGFHYFGPYRPTICALTDFDGDGKDDPSSFDARGGLWHFEGQLPTRFGQFRDVPAPGDYNGDGRAQKVLFRPKTGEWFSPNGILLADFGTIGDIPVPGDYNGDGQDNYAFFRPSEGLWRIKGMPDVLFGQGHDVPVPGDYNGDKKQDIAVYRAETGTWLFADGKKIKFGQYQDIPVPGDYNGDGKAQLAVYRQSTGQWIIRGGQTLKIGLSEDIPIPMDYDGDGKDNLILYRPNSGEWIFPDGTSLPLGKPHSTPVH